MIRPLAQWAVQCALRCADIRVLRYLAVSIGALAVDVGVFLGCLGAGIAPGPAAALGYSLGIIAHWLLSSRAVFNDTVAAGGRGRLVQKSLFVISALAGLALTTLIVILADRAGLDPRAAKLVAIAVSFAVVYLVRSQVVFKDGRR
ncbi:GtrA family protein [Blastomonas aquatica]|uniref:GtrA/DPMS transmembrane domain-containing protein n=1 Tax=Blastomonas aquatica TaxID=1510276 RepID=A0ABQ1J1J2_9SPHN|nr:GtrA family protein [Blastomonas aquatica]GGB55062.1 hypothetical protein GCM10010833_07170 [Blastomonas aquatica]